MSWKCCQSISLIGSVSAHFNLPVNNLIIILITLGNVIGQFSFFAVGNHAYRNVVCRRLNIDVVGLPEKIKRSNGSPSLSCLCTSVWCLSIMSKCIQVCPQLPWHSHKVLAFTSVSCDLANLLQTRLERAKLLHPFLLMLKGFVIFTFALSLNISYVVWNVHYATTALPLPATFHICFLYMLV